MAGNFLQRSRYGTTYFFRRRVLADVQCVLNLGQLLYRSLATADRREAIIRARVQATRTDQLFAQIRFMAKKKSEDLLSIGLIIEIDADELGLPRLKMQPESNDKPEETQKAFQIVPEFAKARQQSAGAHLNCLTALLLHDTRKPRQCWRYGRKEKGQSSVWPWKSGGDEEDRTPDLRIANATLSQLSYVPLYFLLLTIPNLPPDLDCSGTTP